MGIRYIKLQECTFVRGIQSICYSSPAQHKSKISKLVIGKNLFSTSIVEGQKSSNQGQGCSGPKLTKEERQAKTQREKTPAGKLEDEEGGVKHPYQEKEPLKTTSWWRKSRNRGNWRSSRT